MIDNPTHQEALRIASEFIASEQLYRIEFPDISQELVSSAVCECCYDKTGSGIIKLMYEVKGIADGGYYTYLVCSRCFNALQLLQTEGVV